MDKILIKRINILFFPVTFSVHAVKKREQARVANWRGDPTKCKTGNTTTSPML